MKIELGQYRLAHLSNDELCVLAAFLKLPCLYGVSESWMKRGYLGLEERVLRTAAQLERRGLILMEPGGIVRMDEEMHQLVTDMGRTKRLGRVAYAAGNEQGRLYLYKTADGLVTAEQDGRGNCFLGRIGFLTELEEALTGIRETEHGSDSLTRAWMGALAFERRGSLFERIYDLAWTRENGDLTEEWDHFCRTLFASDC